MVVNFVPMVTAEAQVKFCNHFLDVDFVLSLLINQAVQSLWQSHYTVEKNAFNTESSSPLNQDIKKYAQL